MNKQLGKELREIRKLSGETLAHVADAIGIDRSHLTKIELGQDLPSEKVLQNLFAHFSLKGVTASRLWTLAGFTSEMVAAENFGRKEGNMDKAKIKKDPVANINMDPNKTKTLYTDSIFINSSDFGLVVDFARRIGPEQHFVVSSVGMSFEHAKKLLEVLTDHLQKHER